MTATLHRSPLTTAVLEALRAVYPFVGDGELPDANWIGQPNVPGSRFKPFAVLSELTADRAAGPLGAPQGDWQMPYMIEFFGIRREQVSAIADRLRGALNGMRFSKLQLGADTYKVQLVRTDNLGAPQRIDVTQPAFWHQQDSVTVWVGKDVG